MAGEGTLDQLEKEIESEFLDETRDSLSSLNVMLGNFESGLVAEPQALLTLRKSFRALEARSQSVDNAIIGILAHRALEFLSDLQGLSRELVPEIQTFIDVISKQVSGEAAGVPTAEILRQLPFRRIADFDVSEAVKKLNIEVLLVIPDRATGRFIERELAACGYRASNARSFFKGLEMAVRTQPHLIIASAMLDELSGIDLARALAGISDTSRLPFALLTSFAAGHHSLADLPSSASVLRKGSEFGEDFAQTLARFKII